MSVSSTRRTVINFTGDVEETRTASAATNTAAPGQEQVVTLNTGANTITCPGSGTTPTAVTIIPPSGNTQTITLKGVAGDTGISLHLTDPTTIALASGVASFVLTAGGSVIGLRLVWS